MSQVSLSPNSAAMLPSPAGNAGKPGSVFPLVAGCGAMSMVAFPLLVVGLLTPHYAEMYRDFGLRLPAFTRVLLDLGKFAGSPLGVTAAVVLALVIGAITYATGRASRAGGVAILLLCFLWLLGVGGGFFVSNWIVIPAMMESLQDGNAV